MGTGQHRLKERAKLHVVSIIGSIRLSVSLDFERLSDCLGPRFDTSYGRFAIYRPPYMKGTITLYRRGTINIAGETSIDELNKARDKLVEDLQAAGLTLTEIPPVKIANIVATGEAIETINLRSLQRGHPDTVEYEPEVFPGAIVKFPGMTLTALVFATGKYVLTGATDLTELESTEQEILSMIRSIN